MKTLHYLAACALLLSFGFFSSCNPNPPIIPPDGGGQPAGLELHINIVNPEDVLVNIQSVCLTEFSHYSERVILAKTRYWNGSFDIALPAKVSEKYLVPVTERDFGINSIPEISDIEAMITRGSFRLCAFSGNDWRGDFQYEKPDDTNRYFPNELIYVDRDVTIKYIGHVYEFKKGWNYIRHLAVEINPPYDECAHNNFEVLQWYYNGSYALKNE